MSSSPSPLNNRIYLQYNIEDIKLNYIIIIIIWFVKQSPMGIK